MKTLGPVLLVVGLVCIGVSFAWPSFAAPMTQIDEQQAEMYNKALVGIHPGAPTQLSDEERKEKIAQIHEVKEAVRKGKRVQTLGMWGWRGVGIVLAVAGAGMHFWANRED